MSFCSRSESSASLLSVCDQIVTDSQKLFASSRPFGQTIRIDVTASKFMLQERTKMIDALGKKIQIGDMVRVIGAPDLKGMHPSGRRESLPVFRYLVGKYKRVVGFDHGLIQLSFRIRKGKHKGLHSVWIEPELLRVKGTRGKTT